MVDLILRCRGLPFSATEDEIKNFLGGKGISKVIFTNSRDGRPSGEAFAVFHERDGYDSGLAKDRNYMGSRYIEVFASTQAEMNMYTSGGNLGMTHGPNGESKNENFPDNDYVVRLRGLPFNCARDEILQFFSPLVVVEGGIVFPHEKMGRRSTGEAFVFFPDSQSATKALEKNKQNIQHRYIEVFSSSRSDLTRALEGSSSSGHSSWEGYGGRGGSHGGVGGYGGGYGAGDDGGYGGGGSYGGASRTHRPSPYDRPSGGGYGSGGAYNGGDRGYGGRGGGYGGGYEYGYGRGYDEGDYGGYGYGNESGGGDWAGYEASYDYGSRQTGGGPMRGRSDNWRQGGEYNRPAVGPTRYAGGGGGSKLCIKMRGIPFRSVEGDIYEFFSPLRPSSIELLREPGGRPSGEAKVHFSSREEFEQALQKDKQYMGSRYVELFPDHN